MDSEKQKEMQAKLENLMSSYFNAYPPTEGGDGGTTAFMPLMEFTPDGGFKPKLTKAGHYFSSPVHQNAVTGSSIKLRHCAFCLVSIPDADVKQCGKCHKRAYCSRECQVKDWKPSGYGQRHKFWCGLEYGEEGIDWEVTYVNGKGRGVVAKRFFPALSRIMVEGVGIKSKDIFANLQESYDASGRSKLLNHSCDANSAKFPIPDEWLKAMVVFANRDIQEGEEICANYIYYNETSWSIPSTVGFTTSEDARKLLKSKHGIACPSNCICQDEEIEKLIGGARKTDEMLDAVLSNTNPDIAQLQVHVNVDLEMIKLMLKTHKRIRGSTVDKARILALRFRIAVQHKTTLAVAKEAIQEVCHIYSSILHPQCEFAQRHENWKKDLKSHPDYLKLNGKVFGPAPKINKFPM